MSHVTRYEAVRERFLKDAGSHRLEILNDSGVCRTLLFKRPGTGIYHFYITTWPGHLAISGDVGSLTFSRMDDMFQFFRSGHDELSINASYWHEKLVSIDRQSPPKAFSYDLFKRAVVEDYRSWRRHDRDAAKMTADQHREMRDELRTMLHDSDLNEQEAYRRMYEFDFTYYEPSDRYRHVTPFSDITERTLTEYTDNFLWQCFAVAWAVKQYDAHVIAAAPEVPRG